jgi:succinate dehydrogenase/fumarate reductase flavoprotein subunit
MVQVLANEAIRLEVPIFNNTTAVRILVAPSSPRRSAGVITIRPKHRTEDNPLGLAVFFCDFLVIATGGPGELYRDSAYPRHCFGSLGLALEAGLEAVNLTESQFGIGTSRDGFPWNLSGTYVQSMPYVFSLDSRRRESNFLADYYRTTRELTSNIFRKGYQWPFHATRMLDFGSSLFDLAVFRETQAGRKVFMDFNRNPVAVPGDLGFDLEHLDPDVRAYLKNSDALLGKPIDRLRKMNPLSIELYKRYKYDITQNPLEFAINNQHMNGGLAVSTWGETNLQGCYAIGEAAGTHGVTRPGGAALNAGQVFGTRCAEHITSQRHKRPAFPLQLDQIEGALHSVLKTLRDESPMTVDAIKSEVQNRMSDHAGIVCTAKDVQASLAGASALNQAIRNHGIAFKGAYGAARALQWQQMAVTSEAVLAALAFYVDRGGGSRGARAVCSPSGERMPFARTGPLNEFRFNCERAEGRAEQILVRLEGHQFVSWPRPVRSRDRSHRPFFERDWPDFLTEAIFGLTS